MTTTHPSRKQVLSLLLAAVVAFSATVGFAGAAATTDLNVSITDNDNTIASGETTTVEIVVANADGGVGSASYGIELGSPSVAKITAADIAGSPVEPDISQDGSSADVRYFQANTQDSGEVVILTVTLEATESGSTSLDIVDNSDFNNQIVFDEGGAGYSFDSIGSATLTVEETNQAPNADAGEDDTVTAGDTVTLDGSKSTDSNSGDTLSYSWTETTDSGVSLSDASAAKPTFTAPDVDSETTLGFELTVTDDDGASNTDTVSVTVQPPDAANFQVSDLQAPGSAEQGEEITVSADVENTGGQTATKSVEFRLDVDGDGLDADDVVSSQDVQLDADASTTVTFEDVDTSELAPGTYTHGVATPDDSATAEIEITEPPAPSAGETTVSLGPISQQTAVGVSATYDVVVDSAAGGVGAGELRVTVNDTSVAEITDIGTLGSGTSEEVELAGDGSFADIEYAFDDTADTGSVSVVEVTVVGADAGTAGLSIEPSDDNNEVLVFDEYGQGYDVTGTNGATLEVQTVEFNVGSTSAPEKAAVGSTVTVTADVTNDDNVESTQSVELLFDVDDDGTSDSVATEQVTLGAGQTQEVSFEVDVAADTSFGERGYSVETAADSAGGTVEFTPPAISEDAGLPADPDDDDLYEDVNGDGLVDTGDAQALFSNRDSSVIQDYAAQYDLNGDGVVDSGDAQALFSEVTG